MENVRQERPIDLAINGSLPNHHTILQMLAQREKDGPLAKIAAKKYQNVDHEFKATVIDFFDTVDQDQIDARAFFVDELLENPRLEHDHSKGNLSFRWLHLPANNMMWVEVLVARLFDNPAEAYRVLDSERWVGRQHRGGFGAHQNHHARFMRPLCRTFRGISESLFEGDTPRSDDISSKECLVLFMPYLHWDTVDQQEKREHIMNQPLREQQLREERHPENERPEQEPPEHIVPLPNKDQRLTAAYLLEAHPLHVRRTLDQYYYHSMLDTKRRDIDQVVSRYQKDQNLNPKVISMVDQLWLWVLPGAGDQVDTVITSFPSREHVSSTLGVEDPDPYDFTDVLRSIKMQLLAERSSVRTACDLAGIIASQCSKAYLDIGTMNERPGFSEIYEIAISDVMRKEADLFENFNILTKASDEEVALSSDLVDMLASDPIARDALPLASLVELCERYRNNPFHGPLTASNITNWFSLPATNQRAAAMHLITKIGRIQVLDISREISLLREVKDIQDELSIMSVLFDDQKKVLTTLESVIRSKAAPKSSLKALQRRKVHSERELGEVRNAFSAFDMRPVQITSTNQAQDNFLEKRKMVHFPIEEENEASSSTKRRSSPPPTPPELPNESPTQRVDGWVETGKATKDFSDSDRFLELNAGHQGTINIGSIITDNRASETFGEGDARKPTSPLAVVQVCIDEIGRMFQRARKANQALDFLVDLKQTQSNVLDSRSARIQAEESLKMTEQSVTMTREMVNLTGQTAETNAQIVTLTQETVKMNEENKKQGKTLMVFTIVTIIFLPLSFMAAFFAINIGAFHRDDKGFLGLGYVSEIMFPISAMITGALIYVAFRVERLEDIRIWMKKLIKRRKRVSGVVVGGVVGGATGGGGAVVGASGGSAV
ncbi:hypothetical protein BDZ45DRAFT_75687 [Acephala macrosclerotiorum]|nr:hypothetical protein BDZ45DRAFT_75687 [Acephala macrosclerotiorum]